MYLNKNKPQVIAVYDKSFNPTFSKVGRVWGETPRSYTGGEKMKLKKLAAVLLITAMAVSFAGCGSQNNGSGSSASASAAESTTGEKTFVYGTTGYGESMGDTGLNPHSTYSGWSTIRYGVGETLFKYSDSMEAEPWLAEGYEFVDDNTVKITLKDGIKFSSGRDLDAEAVKECFEDLTF